MRLKKKFIELQETEGPFTQVLLYLRPGNGLIVSAVENGSQIRHILD